MTLMETVAGVVSLFGVGVGIIFTVVKTNRDNKREETERIRIRSVQEASDKISISSLQESVLNLRKERERLIEAYNKKLEDMEEEMSKLEGMIQRGDSEAAKECQQMRNQMHQFIQDTWKIIMTK